MAEGKSPLLVTTLRHDAFRIAEIIFGNQSKCPMSNIETTRLRILLLEDSNLDAELALRELRQGGIEFLSVRVENGTDFQKAIHEFRPDLILADFKLPTFDGRQALALAQETGPDIPLIIISGAVGEETAVELLKNGATDFVLKDRLAGRLVPAVQRALREVADRQARQRAEAELRALNAQLEQRVAERTRELWAKNAIMEEDLGMARELQMAFLPQHFPTLPRGVEQAASAVKFHSIFHPSNSVSGDFFNVVSVSDTAVGIFICDVMGHGVRAALVTAMMRALEEHLCELTNDPGAMLTEMNQALRGILRQLNSTIFATACYVVVDISNGHISFANAGHPSPLLVHALSGKVEPVTAHRMAGPALGLFENALYPTYQLPVAAGDRILAFTDGLFEAENANSQEYSLARLHDSILHHKDLPLKQLMHTVFTEIKNFAEDEIFSDDVCFVGIEITLMEAGGVAASA
jgi:serine phosphatase RsbU (regulator of sigma subunit)